MKSESFIAIPPGETLKEVAERQGYSQKELALRLGLSEKHVSNLINAKCELTKETAAKLESVLGVPASFWNNLEARYREILIKVEQENTMSEELAMEKQLPFSEMVSNGWILSAATPEARVSVLRTFFSVAKLKLIANPDLSLVAFRELSKENRKDLKLLAWLTQAKREADGIDTSEINIKKVTANLQAIRQLTLEKSDFNFGKLKQILSQCGIALVVLPHLKGSYLQGLSFKYKNKIVLGLTARGKELDKFWFSLFHELGHIILGHLRVFDEKTADREKLADDFAKNVLIPKEAYEKFTTKHNFSKKAIIAFSKRVGIDAGIVVGRLQKDKFIDYHIHNDLKSRVGDISFFSSNEA